MPSKMVAVTSTALVVLAAAQDAAQAQTNPLQKVLTLITEMKSTTEKEMKEDEDAYAKYACWCKTNDAEKTDAIEEATSRLEELTSFVEEAAAKSSQLKTEIGTLEGEIAEDTEALETATALRTKENAEFQVSEKDMSETLDALSNAVDVLGKVQLLQKQQGGGAVVVDDDAQASLVQVRRVVEHRFPRYREVMQRDLFDVLGSFSDTGNLRRAALVQDAPREGGAAKGAKSHNSRSGAIFGILSEMKDETARDLANAQKGEATAQAAFDRLSAAKQSEIKSGTEQRESKETHLAELTNKAAKANEDIAAMEKAKAADEDFLANLKSSCAKEATEYDSRVKVRTEEITALGETLEILTGDEARDLLGKTMSFVQVQESSTARARQAAEDHAADRAMKKLAAIAQKHGSWSLASLAVRVRLDGFEKVLKTIDNMLAELKKQQQEEYDKKEKCDKDIDATEDKIKVSTIKKDDLEEQHKALTNDLSVLAADIEKLNTDVADMKVGLKQAGETRAKENALFQQTIADQRATIHILNMALSRLEDFYGKATLVQIQAHRAEPGAAAPPPPPTPKDYEKRPAGGVLGLIQMIIKDAEKTEQEMDASEQSSQADYEKLVADTAASIDANNGAISEKEAQLSSSEGEKAETQEAQLANDQELEKLKDLLGAHHTDCDWVLKYFDIRQEARREEMDGIEEAKAILSGAKFGGSAASLTQQAANEAFDDQ